MKMFIQAILATMMVFFMSACGGGSDSTPASGGVGYLIDAPIAGVTYECDGKVGTTDNAGKFECSNPPVVFKIGSLIIGTLTNFTPDSKVYPQDLLGLSRDNFSDPELIALVRLLQSLDDDGEYSSVIYIPQDSADKFNVDGEFDADKLDEYVATADVELVSEEDAIKHLKDNIIDVEPVKLDLSNINPGTSDVVAFNDSFIALEDDVYYALECEDIIDSSGNEMAHFDLVEKKFHEMGLPLSIENESLVVDAGRIKMVYTIPSGLSDMLGGDSAFIVVSNYLDGNRMSFSGEVWYHVGEIPVGFNANHEPVTGACDGARDIDVISRVWYTITGDQNTWTNREHNVEGACNDDNTYFNMISALQDELDRWGDADCPAYQLGQ